MYALLTLRGLTVRRKFFKISLYFFTTLFLLFSIGFGALLYRLHKAPISLEKYIPTFVDIITPDDGSKISIKSALLTWNNWRHPINIRVAGFRMTDKDGKTISTVREMTATFSLFALMHGIVAPRTIEIYNPTIDLTVNSETGDYEDVPQTDDSETRFSVKNFLTRLEQEHYLRRFSLIDARARITDVSHNAVWNIPNLTLTYSRRRGKHKLHGAFTVETAKKPLLVSLFGTWNNKAKDATLTLSAQNADITASRAARKYEFLQGFAVPLDITADLKINLSEIKSDEDLFLWREIVKTFDFTLTGGAGTVVLPASIGGCYDIESFTVAGSWFDAGNKLVIPNFTIATKSGVSARGEFQADGLGKAMDTKNPTDVSARFEAFVSDVPVERVPDYWPESAAPDVHRWVKENITQGFAPSGSIQMTFSGSKDGLNLDALNADIQIEKARVTYMDDMPAVENVKAALNFTKSDLSIVLINGNTDSVTLQKGTLVFSGLNADTTDFILNTDLETADISDVFKILSSPALEITQASFINPDNISGQGTANFRLMFPMRGGPIDSADVRVSVTADVENVDLSHYLIDALNIQSAAAHLDLTEKEMRLTGTGKMRTGNASFSLHQAFSNTPDVLTDLKVSAELTNEARADLGIDLLNPPNIDGVIPADFTLRFLKDKTGQANIALDLTPADINMSVIGWKKQSGIAGKGTAELQFSDFDFAAVPMIELTDALKTKIRAKIDFSAAHALKKIDVDRISTGRTHLQARARFLKNAVRIDIAGPSLDWADLMKASTPEKRAQSAQTADEEEATSAPPVVINAALDKIWLSESGGLDNNGFAGIYSDGGWRKMDATGSIGKKQVPLRFSLSPTTTPDEYAFALSSQDAGYALKVLNYISTVKGGTLQVKGTYSPNHGTKGLLEVKDFYLENQPILTRLLRLTSFTGIYDTLTGQGLNFSKAEIPYQIDKTAITLKDALITGSSLGITLNGLYNRDTGFLDLYGSLLPFYGVNSLPGKIPLIGKLFVGEKGGGLIGVSYSVKGLLPTPDVSVNPLSAFAPGAARNLFN